MKDLRATFGNIDIYLFDQLLKGRFLPSHKILDAGCGGGRNLEYLLKQGYEVWAIDPNPEAVAHVRAQYSEWASHLSAQHIQQTTIEEMPFDAATFDVVICNAVLHFARDQQQFEAMLFQLWKVLKPGGYLFTRLASKIGIEKDIRELGNGNFLLPDGSTRFLVDEQMLFNYTLQLKGELFEYLKTTNVQGLRAMTTWCVQKVKME